MKFHSDTREWVYDSEERCVTWKSFFPEYQFDSSDFGIVFFYSPYYTAEDSNIEVRMKGGTTIGWLVTISYLQEKDEDLISSHKPWLNHFAQIGICLLTKHIVENECGFIKNQEECCLSEVELPPCHLLVFRRSQMKESDLPLLLSEFYDNGFYYIGNLNDAIDGSLFYKSSYQNSIVMGNPCTTISLSKCELADDLVPLLNYLYNKWLPFAYVNPFGRYIYLYQIVEYFMEVAFEESLYKHINDFNNKSISKNDLRNQIGSDSKEETKIEMVFDGIPSSSPIIADFKQNVDAFLDRVGVDFQETSIGKYVYKVRNVLVHNMRIAIAYEVELNNVVECFEKLIALKLRKGMSSFHDKHMVVCDISEKYKKNKKRMRRTYIQYKYGK